MVKIAWSSDQAERMQWIATDTLAKIGNLQVVQVHVVSTTTTRKAHKMF